MRMQKTSNTLTVAIFTIAAIAAFLAFVAAVQLFPAS